MVKGREKREKGEDICSLFCSVSGARCGAGVSGSNAVCLYFKGFDWKGISDSCVMCVLMFAEVRKRRRCGYALISTYKRRTLFVLLLLPFALWWWCVVVNCHGCFCVPCVLSVLLRFVKMDRNTAHWRREEHRDTARHTEKPLAVVTDKVVWLKHHPKAKSSYPCVQDLVARKN